MSAQYVTGFDDFYSAKGLHQLSAADYAACDAVPDFAHLLKYANVIDSFERHFVREAHESALLGLDVTLPKALDALNEVDKRYEPDELGFDKLLALRDLEFLADEGACAHLLPAGPARDRAYAMRSWCRGLKALYSAPLDKELITDDQKRWSVIEVLGVMHQ